MAWKKINGSLTPQGGKRDEEGELGPWEIRNFVLSRAGDIELLVRLSPNKAQLKGGPQVA